MPASPSLVARLRGTMDVLYREMVKFGIVGAVAFVVDLGLFNVLRATVLSGYGSGPLSRAVVATIISAFVATCVAWVGNRMWTFRHRRNRPVHHEALLFALTNGVALLIQAACVGFSHHVLGQESLVAENLAKLVGIALGTLFRFWAYRRFVFSREPLEDTSPLAATAD
ncbi:GtrA family protein [Pedococcus sp. 5OH_020]|uniref:GtrA family protein n=1 Tax=Pedococcus sp. 5OH_020 TaxID=2989814 RepID=UPI0022E9A072|nr:GtrA family protein [Pedococcus sp. 5OH_020]